MSSHQLHCDACARPVRIMVTAPHALDGPPNMHDAEVICLDVGEQCTGGRCPLGKVEPDAMVSRLIRNGLPLDGMKSVFTLCPACDSQAEMVLYGDGHAACTVCGTPARWVLRHAEPLT